VRDVILIKIYIKINTYYAHFTNFKKYCSIFDQTVLFYIKKTIYIHLIKG